MLDIPITCPWFNASFTQHLLKTLNSSSYIGYAVSVRNSSGAILGCGQFEKHYPVYASYNGKIVFQQFSQYHSTAFVGWSWATYKITYYSLLESVGDTCPSSKAVFDPWKPPPEQVGDEETPDRSPVGELSKRRIRMYSLYFDVPLIGSATILGHMVCAVYITITNSSKVAARKTIFNAHANLFLK